ncbi:MAG: UPF0182 family protein [Firmicutes bacterium]|nr:UPF0182 family protein [Bacillota bacterium]
MKKSILIPAILVAVVLLLMLGTSYYTEYLWYSSMGITEVFLKPFVANLAIKAVLFVFAFGFLLANFLPLTKSLSLRRLRVIDASSDSAPGLKKKHAVYVALAVSAFWALVLPALWDRVLLFLNSVPTGEVDPILGWDTAFYLFQYPLLQLLSGAFISLLFFAVIPVALAYFAGGNIAIVNNRLQFDGKARTHLSVLLALFLLWFAASRFLAMADLLTSDSTALFGAGYTDVNVRLPLIRVQQVVAVVLGALVLVNVGLRRSVIVYAVPVALVLMLAVTGIAGAVYQSFIVNPNEQARELPYLEHHLLATRQAYGLDAIDRRTFPLDRQEEITREALAGKDTTLENIRILDYRPLKQHYLQNQSLRLYYTFNDIDIDRYRLDDEYRQVMLAVRELDINALPQRTPINEHFRYTHGYGVVMSPVNAVTSTGHPTYFYRNIPVESTIDLPLDRPEIYFGEMTNQFVVVNSRGQEYGYPDGDDNTQVDYQGTDGVELNPMRRLLFALKYQKPILLLSDEITPESRILFHRNVVERVNKVAPFIHTDSDPYPVVADGRVFWIIDGYTTADNYPYSQPRGRYNYIRNSVKVVVDAYNGTVDVYKFAEDDPIIDAWQGVFPGLIQERSEFPAYLEEHVRYPVDYFNIQADILRKYHVNSPNMLYQGGDVLEIPVEQYAGRETEVEPYYVTMQLPEGEEAEYVLMLPFTPQNRNNMTAWLAARNDGEHYGELVLYSFPRGEHVEGPSQVEAAIDQHPDISSQLTLWSQGGSTVNRGNLLVIPLNGSVLYVEPLYLQSENRSVPEMRQVIVYYQGELAMESTLDQALDAIFGILEDDPEPSEPGEPGEPGDPGAPVDPGQPVIPGTVQELLEQINTAYDDMEAAARDGRWADYGDKVEELGSLLAQLEDLLSADE